MREQNIFGMRFTFFTFQKKKSVWTATWIEKLIGQSIVCV